MLTNAKALEQFKVRTRDGAVGNLRDIYFKDDEWKVRYLIVEVGGGTNEREVLISPRTVVNRDSETDELLVDLTKEQIHASPSVDSDKPHSFRSDAEPTNYQSDPPYWTAPSLLDLKANPSGPAGSGHNKIIPFPAEALAAGVHTSYEETPADPHLRSMREVAGYRIEASDGDIGHVEDFVIDDRRWNVPFLIVDTKNWWPGKRLLIPARGISGVSWSEAVVFVSLPRDVIQRSPEYDSDIALSAEYTSRLEAYYTHQLSE